MERTEETLKRAAELLTFMRSDILEQKLLAAKEIPFISQQIGPERTIKELLPFLPGMISFSNFSYVLLIICLRVLWWGG